VWFPGETISVGIGQGYMLVTPMQLAHAVSGIASRGKIFKPRLVTAVRKAGTDTLAPRSRYVCGIALVDRWHRRDRTRWP